MQLLQIDEGKNLFVKCLDCINLNLKAYPKHSNTGFGRCNKETQPGVFESITINRECSMYQQAPAQTMIDRTGWMDGKKALEK